MTAKSSWKIPYFNLKFFKKKKNFKNTNAIKIKNKDFQIFKPMIGQDFLVYDGAHFNIVTPWKDVVSHKVGEFLKTKVEVIHTKKKKIKALEKKAKEEKKKIKISDKKNPNSISKKK